MKKEWFETWFDSKYYHILYSNRDYDEAERFIKRLIEYLSPKNNSSILDLGCGKGRHSVFLNRLGYNVTGLDLSKNSIDSVKDLNSDSLYFDVWDMRDKYKKSDYDYVFNLFTSFGYFDSHEENLKVLNSAYYDLKPGGILVLDYLNEKLVRKHIPSIQIIEKNGLLFNISKSEINNSVVKKIEFVSESRNFSFSERVQLIRKDTFLELFKQSGFIVREVFGNYDLAPYIEEESKRMIFIVEKGL